MKDLIPIRAVPYVAGLLLAMVVGGSCHAGPFADWWLNNSSYGYANNGPVIPLTPAPQTSGYGTYPYNAYTGYPNTSYSPIVPAGLPQTIPAWLPTGGYASQYYRAPTTYYRPVTSLDPNTGTTVTSLQPCASYQYQAQRVPLLVPQWSNYAYGGYGASSLQNRWSPITAPAVGSAAGQSSLSIASGMGTYGTSPVVQIPMSGGVLNTAPALPTAQPITSGYGGIYQAAPVQGTSVTSVGSNSVVPAAAWSGYFGNVPQTFTQPATISLPSSPITSGYSPSGPTTNVNGVTITPIGPPVTSTYPTSPITSGSTFSGSSTTSMLPSQPTLPPSTIGSMPGSMGQPIMPSAVSPHAAAPSTVFPPVMPSTPAPTSSWSPSPPSSWSPATTIPGNSSQYDKDAMAAPSLNPTIAESRKPEVAPIESQPRFQLRSVERTPVENQPANEAPRSPWTNQSNDKFNSNSTPESTKESAEEPVLKLNMDALRPIPAPQNFDATPDWKPALLNARDQTAAERNIRTIDRQPASSGSYHEVRFLNSVR
jgi:hypothetical protein